MNGAQTEWIVKYGNEYGRSLSMQMMNALHGSQFLMIGEVSNNGSVHSVWVCVHVCYSG